MIPDRVDLGLGHVRIALQDVPDISTVGAKYGPATGFTQLRSRIAEWEQTSEEQIAITTGASLGLAAALASLRRPSSVLCPRPYYPAYPKLLALFGLDVLYYDLEAELGWLPDPAKLKRMVRSDTSAILWNFPNNPTGSLPGMDLIREMKALVDHRNLLVLSDEVYGDFVYEPRAPVRARLYFDKEQVVQFSSFSKTLGIPGERLGYLVATPDRIQPISRIHWTLAMSPPSTAQAMALALAGQRMEERISLLRASLAISRGLATTILRSCENLRFSAPPAGVFLWMEVKDSPVDSNELSRLCAETAGVIVVPGAAFGVNDPVFLRASFGLEADEVQEGFQRLASVLCGLRTNKVKVK